MGSGGSPENCPKIVKHIQNRRFRRTLGKSSKNRPRKLQNRQTLSKYVFFGQLKYYFLTITLSGPPAAAKRGAAAFGRRPSFGQ